MMTVFKRLTISVVSLGLAATVSADASAQTVDPGLCEPQGRIFFINGVRTSRARAAAQAAALDRALRAAGEDDVSAALPVRVAYNSTNVPAFAEQLRSLGSVSPFLAANGIIADWVGSAGDFVEATFQRLVDDVDGLERLDVARVVAADNFEAYQQQYARTADQDVFDRVRNAYQEIEYHTTAALRQGARDLITSGDLRGHVDLFRNTINQGQRVVVVAYSQGNLFANLSYEALSPNEREAFGIVSVATPASTNESGGAHITLDTDGLVDTLRTFLRGLDDLFGGFPPPLPANLNGNGDPRFEEHDFAARYLRPGSSSRNQIISEVTRTLRDLIPPEATLGAGVITVTLNWGAEPDVDLHVFEPNGTQVYYANRRGPSGFLDTDDVTSFGPENYFVACETLELGVYRVGVNYFRGSGPETADITITTPDGTTAAPPVRLIESRGAAGNSDPVPVGEINVRSEAGQLLFDVDY